MVRGELFRLRQPRAARGREQRGARYAVIIQADELLDLATVLVAPTSRSAPPRSFRPLIEIGGTPTRVMVEQLTAIDPERLGRSAGRLSTDEIAHVDAALALLIGI